jgi:hypothetical protein
MMKLHQKLITSNFTFINIKTGTCQKQFFRLCFLKLFTSHEVIKVFHIKKFIWDYFAIGDNTTQFNKMFECYQVK